MEPSNVPMRRKRILSLPALRQNQNQNQNQT